MTERKQKWMEEIMAFREIFCQEIGVFDKISAEELDLLERKQAMGEPLRERRRSAEVKEWRDTVVVGDEVAQMAAAGSESSEAEGDLLLSEMRVLP